MLVKWRPDLDALAAVFGCFGAVFERSSTSCSRCPKPRNRVAYFQLANFQLINHLSAAPLLTECSLKIVTFVLSWASIGKSCHSYILHWP